MKNKEKKQKKKLEQSERKLNEELEKLQSQIESLQQEKEALFAKLQRLSADYANFQKRSVKQASETIAYEKEQIVKALLPPLDNFEHTLQNTPDTDKAQALSKGVKIIYEQILDILQLFGVEQIQALNRKFDPSVHEAMMKKFDSEKEQDIVLEVFQKGYKLNGRVIRPSKVVVNKLPSEEIQVQQKQEIEEKESEETTGTNEQQNNNEPEQES